MRVISTRDGSVGGFDGEDVERGAGERDAGSAAQDHAAVFAGGGAGVDFEGLIGVENDAG